MTPRELLEERLRRIARNLRFRHYVVCPHCYGPIIVLPLELENPPSYLACEECGKLNAFDPGQVFDYEPPA